MSILHREPSLLSLVTAGFVVGAAMFRMSGLV